MSSREKTISQPPIAIKRSPKIIGKRESLQRPEDRTLLGRTIIITRSSEQGSALSISLQKMGACAITFPTIAVVPVLPGGKMDIAIHKIEAFDWIVFTSTNGVNLFLKRLFALRRNVPSLQGIKIACIGPGTTAALQAHAIDVDVTAQHNVAEGLIAALENADTWKGKKVLIPSAKKTRNLIPMTLKQWGANVQVVTVYETVKPKTIDKSVVSKIVEGNYDCIVFTSSSTFTNFKEMLGLRFWKRVEGKLRAVSIGPVTTETIRSAGIEPLAEAKPHTIDGLIECVKNLLLK